MQFVAGIAVWLLASFSWADDAALRAARSLFLKGQYAESIEAYDRLLADPAGSATAAASAGVSDVFLALGEIEAARETLAEAVAKHPGDADLLGRLAQVQFDTGDWDDAQASAERAIREDTDALRARLVLAHLHRESGRLDEALEAYRWFVRYYNREQPGDVESLLIVAEGSLEYARWKGVSSVFHFVVNTLCPDALQADPLDWRVPVLSGDLLLEKYNESQATAEFETALKMNPLAVEAHVGLARAALQRMDYPEAAKHVDEALATNPNSLAALIVRAELELEASEPAKALPYVERALAANSRSQAALACRAVCDLLENGSPTADRLDELLQAIGARNTAFQPASDFERLTLEVAARNPRPGEYLIRLGEFFDGRKKYAHAEHCYRAVVKLMPQLSAAQTNLGLLDMRVGRIDEAREILDRAFKADPFHVRVSNMRKVLGVLEDFDTLRTEHFTIRVDPSDRMLAEYMADYLEEVHAQLSREYDYEPPAPTQFEVYTSAHGQTAHQWFSARMVGLPWIQTIGASTGAVVALASPQAVDRPFHWGRVVRHEYVHILTLQKTDFNIPHWYTEALAVRSEGVGLTEEWKSLLLRRATAGKLYTLRTIDEGFRRPETPGDWNTAYCQSWLYAKLIADGWGEDALTKLVDAYGRGLRTGEALAEVLNTSEADFESQYTQFVADLVQEVAASRSRPSIDVDEAAAAHRADPANAGLAGRYAYALLRAEQEGLARNVAEKALALLPEEPLASVVLAEIAVANRQEGEAERLLAQPASREPNAVLLRLKAERAFNHDRLQEAGELFQRGVDQFPLETAFWQGLAVVRVKQADVERAIPVLAELAARDPENINVRTQLARWTLERGDFDAARRWAREVLFVDLESVDGHVLLGRALFAQQDHEASRTEFERALELDPACTDAMLGLAQYDRSVGNVGAAIERLQRLLRDHPEHSEAAELLKELQSQRQ